jgi:hypothetical protein
MGYDIFIMGYDIWMRLKRAMPSNGIIREHVIHQRI